MTADTRRMLDLAAKAMGYTGRVEYSGVTDECCFAFDVDTARLTGKSDWSPLTNSGDALELAAALRLTVGDEKTSPFDQWHLPTLDIVRICRIATSPGIAGGQHGRSKETTEVPNDNSIPRRPRQLGRQPLGVVCRLQETPMTLRSKTTPWFDGDVKPVRSGVYERELDPFAEFSWYCAKSGLWGYSNSTPQRAQNMSEMPSVIQNARWRGLVEPKP